LPVRRNAMDFPNRSLPKRPAKTDSIGMKMIVRNSTNAREESAFPTRNVPTDFNFHWRPNNASHPPRSTAEDRITARTESIQYQTSATPTTLAPTGFSLRICIVQVNFCLTEKFATTPKTSTVAMTSQNAALFPVERKVADIGSAQRNASFLQSQNRQTKLLQQIRHSQVAATKIARMAVADTLNA